MLDVSGIDVKTAIGQLAELDNWVSTVGETITPAERNDVANLLKNAWVTLERITFPQVAASLALIKVAAATVFITNVDNEKYSMSNVVAESVSAAAIALDSVIKDCPGDPAIYALDHDLIQATAHSLELFNWELFPNPALD